MRSSGSVPEYRDQDAPVARERPLDARDRPR